MFAGERRPLVIQQATHDGGGFVQHVQPRADVWKGKAVRGRLVNVPASAQAKLETPAAQVIQRHCGLGQQGRIAIAHAEHQATDPRVAGIRRQRAQRRQCLEVRLIAALERRFVEVIPNRNPIDLRRVQAPPELAQLGNGQVLLTDVNTKRNGHERNPKDLSEVATIAARSASFARHPTERNFSAGC